MSKCYRLKYKRKSNDDMYTLVTANGFGCKSTGYKMYNILQQDNDPLTYLILDEDELEELFIDEEEKE